MTRFTGWLLIVAGVLIAGTSGLCSLWAIFNWYGPDDDYLFRTMSDLLPAVVIFGGIPFVIGLGCMLWGRAVLKKRTPESDVFS